MNRVLAFCWREWRAQRSVLVAFTGIGLAALVLGFAVAAMLLPDAWWREERRTLVALSCFPALGLLAIGACVAPALVRSEFGARDDAFVQRLPGALLPSLLGKLLFLVLTCAALPLACLLAGEGVLTALGWPFHGEVLAALFDGEVSWRAADRFWPAIAGGGAALLAPWVWAAGTWLPKGRMGIGGVVLLFLLLGLAVTAVLRQHQGLEQGIAWPSWIPYVPAAGLAVAAASWLALRAGGPLRCARAGLAATALVLLPPTLWLCGEVHRYRHPDLTRLGGLSVASVTDDGRFALVRAAEHHAWTGAPFRVDLATGEASPLPELWYIGEALRRWPFDRTGSRRFLRAVTPDDTHTLLDLQSGEWTALDYDATSRQPRWPVALRARIAADLLARSPLRLPDGRRWLVLDGEVLVAGADGAIERRPWPEGDAQVQPAGHGARLLVPGDDVFVDASGRRVRARAGKEWVAMRAVRDRWLFVEKPSSPGLGRWQQLEPDGSTSPIAALHEAAVLGLANDEEVLCHVPATPQRAGRLFLYRPADRGTRELALPDGFAVQYASVVPWRGGERAVLPRDPAGRIWLACWQAPALRARTRRDGDGVLWIDPVAATATRCPFDLRGSWSQLLAWPDADTVIAQEDTRIVRIDVATGARTVLFPR
jgi:hypothetical protein